MLKRIKATGDGLEAFPSMGREGRVAGTRERVVSETPYVIAYRITDSHIQILDIFHSARKWPEAFSDPA
jgi:toxin ParE1/3/4